MDREIDRRVRRKRMLRRWAGTAASATAFIAVLAVLPGWLRPSVHRSRIRVGTVERGDLEATLRASGQVVPAVEQVLSSPVEARILRVLRQPGAFVETGETILELDTSAIRFQLAQLEEKLTRNENDGRQRQLEYHKTLTGLRHQIETQQLDLEIASYRLTRNRKLHADGLVSEESFKESEVAHRKAIIRLQQLEDGLAAAEQAHQADLERLELDARILGGEIEEIRRQLALATLRVEHPGVLTWVVAEPGATVRRGDVVARIADLKSFRVEATVSDAYAGRLEVGQTVHILIGDESLSAVVSRILPTIEAGTVRFVVELDDPSHPRLRQNLRVDVLVVTGFRNNVLKIPRGPYIRGGGDLHRVFVVHGDRAERREIRLGLVGHEHYEVVEGLEEGDEIILSDMSHRIHASRIRVK